VVAFRFDSKKLKHSAENFGEGEVGSAARSTEMTGEGCPTRFWGAESSAEFSTRRLQREQKPTIVRSEVKQTLEKSGCSSR
jgi:hypothetical protein